MYDNDTTPTAESAQAWLNFLSFWKEKHWAMVDRFLQDFSSAWGPINPDAGGVKETIPQELYDESVKLARQKAASVSVAGFQIQMDENGALTIIQSGSHYIMVAASDTPAFIAALNALSDAPDPTIIDVNSNGLPRTNSQMSMSQNELTLKYLKQRR